MSNMYRTLLRTRVETCNRSALVFLRERSNSRKSSSLNANTRTHDVDQVNNSFRYLTNGTPEFRPLFSEEGCRDRVPRKARNLEVSTGSIVTRPGESPRSQIGDLSDSGSGSRVTGSGKSGKKFRRNYQQSHALLMVTNLRLYSNLCPANIPRRP